MNPVQRLLKNAFSSQSYDVFAEDDPFWELYNNLNPTYRSQLDPYLHFNYKMGLKDMARSAFGGRNGLDALRESMSLKAYEMLGNLQNDVFQNNWNSAQQQVAREKNAGVNPDLNADIQGDPAAGIEQPSSIPQIDFLTPPSTFTDDIISALSDASAVLSAASSFGEMISSWNLRKKQEGLFGAQQSLTEEEMSGQQITNASTARDTIAKYLKGLPPDAWKSTIVADPESSTGFSTLKHGFDSFISRMPASARKYMNAAFEHMTSDPELMRPFYEESLGAMEARQGFIAGEKQYGSLDFVEDYIKQQNKESIGWFNTRIRLQNQFNNAQLEWNNAIANNGITLEEFRAKYKVPENIARGEELMWIAHQSDSQLQSKRNDVDAAMLDYLHKQARSDDPEVKTSALLMLQQYFAKQGAILRQTGFGVTGGFSLSPNGFGANFGYDRNRQNPLTVDPTIDME